MACGKMTMECYCLTYGKEINFQIANLTHDHMCRQHATWAGKVVPLGYSTTVGLVMLAFFCGKNCKVIGYTVVSKGCSFCNRWKKRKNNNLPIPEHEGRKNWNGSSGAMDPCGCLQLFVRLCNNNKVIVEKIVADDDSSIKSK